MASTIYGIETTVVDKDSIYNEITKTLNEMKKQMLDKNTRPYRLFLTSKQSFVINFESVMYAIAGKFILTQREYKRYKKQTAKLMKMILRFKQKEKADE